MELILDPIDLSPENQIDIPKGKPGERSGIDQGVKTRDVTVSHFPTNIQMAINATLAAGGKVTFYPRDSRGNNSPYQPILKGS